jgi:hypothetical protein
VRETKAGNQKTLLSTAVTTMCGDFRGCRAGVVLWSSLSPRIRAGVQNKQPIRLVEESRLSGRLIGIAKVAKPNAN